MKVTGVIAEYNPFHNGHKYHLEKSRSITDADYIIAVISGNFTQRGTPAVLDKYYRTEMALTNGADLVLELPVAAACGSAEYFAMGAVSLLDKTGVVDFLSFGSECGDLSALWDIASCLQQEPKAYQNSLKAHLKNGNSYPLARNKALCEVFPYLAEKKELLKSPNNVLGIEYLKALSQRSSRIRPVTLERKGAGYHDTNLFSSMSSATAIRKEMLHYDCAGTLPAKIKEQLPPNIHELFYNACSECPPVCPSDLSSILLYKLISDEKNGYTRYLDITEDLSDKIKKNIYRFTDFDSFCDLLKSKDLTHSRISRCLCHILLNITKDTASLFASLDYAPYARILGFRKEASPLLHALKNKASIPLLSKLAKAKNSLSFEAALLLETDIFASHIYRTALLAKTGNPVKSEFTRQIKRLV